jgi:NAD-dependent deacetylase
MEEVEDAARSLVKSKYTTALTGAGISTESGIPDFRGPSGIWTKFGEPDMLGYERFLRDPKAWWEKRIKILKGVPEGALKELYERAQKAKPNPGHFALAELEKLGILKSLITQNVDGLHQAAGSKNVIEIHGNLRKLRCVECGRRYNMKGREVDPALGTIEIDEKELPPRCPSCGGIIKTDGVLFGEPIPSDVLPRCFEEAKRCDCMIVAGTSAVVYPAASLPEIAKRKDYVGLGAVIIEVNAEETGLTYSISDHFLKGKTGRILPLLVEKVKEMR